MPSTDQPCSTDGCDGLAAFRTRKKPAWCEGCLGQLLWSVGLQPAEPFPGSPKKYWLTRCVKCGVQAHYRLEYVLDKQQFGERVCRACFWIRWGQQARSLAGRAKTPIAVEAIRAHLDQHGFDLVQTLLSETSSEDPVLTRCRRCGKVTAERMSDVSFDCTCSRNTRAANPTPPTSRDRPPPKELLVESGSSVLRWWDHDRNEDAALREVTVRATREAHWVCPDCSHQFTKSIREMTHPYPACPVCSARQAEVDAALRAERRAMKQVTPVSSVPALLEAWDDPADPRTVMLSDTWLRKLRCPRGHHPRVGPESYLSFGCPSCRGQETRENNQQFLAEISPEIASQWHPKRNGRWVPANVVWDSKRVLWWRADCCGHEWRASPRDRDKYQRLRCPECRTILGSLAWVDPGLAAEWSPENPRTAWEVRPHASTPFVPWWVCANDPNHRWQMALTSRSTGGGCPECREFGKSRIELDHHAAAERAFGSARSGVVLRCEKFVTRTTWTADILANVAGCEVVVEYDGAYWHAPDAKRLVDERKSSDLLAAGYYVVRLREHPLPFLAQEHPRLLQLTVLATVPRPDEVMAQVRDWVGTGQLA